MSRNKLERFLEVAPNGIIRLDEDFNVCSVNKMFEQISGYSQFDLHHKNVDLIFPDTLKEHLIKILKFNKSFSHFETELQTKSNNLLSVSINGTLIIEENYKNIYLFIQDQTKFKEEKEQLVAYQKFFSLNEDMMAILSRNGYFFKLNNRISRVLGYSEDYLINVPFLKLFYIDDLSKANKAFQDVFNGKIMVNFFARVLTQKREIKWFSFSASYDSSSDQVYTSVRDVTENKINELQIQNANKKIKEQEYKYRQLFDKSGDAILIIKNGIFIDCNQAAVKLFNAQEKSYFINSPLSKITPMIQPNGQLSEIKAKMMLDIVLKKGTNKFECNYVKRTGEQFPVEIFLTKIKSKINENVIHCIVKDLTEIRSKTLELKEQLRRNKRLISTTLDGYILTDENGKILEVNKSYAQMVGYAEGELLFKNIYDIEMTMSPLKLDNIQKKITINEKVKYETKHICKNGSIIYVEISLAIIKIKNKPTRIAQFIRNITDRKKEEIRKSVYNVLSQKLNINIGLFEFIETVETQLKKMIKINIFHVMLYSQERHHLSSIYSKKNHLKLSENISRKNGNGLCEYVIKSKKGLRFNGIEKVDFIIKNNITLQYNQESNWMGVPLISEGQVLGVLTVENFKNKIPYSNEDFEALEFIGVQLGRLIIRINDTHKIELLNSTLEEQVEVRTKELVKTKNDLLIALEKEKELSELKSKFVSTASHQFRTPLTVIQTSLGILELQKNKLDSSILNSFNKIIERIKSQISHMTGMMDDLLNLAKINEQGLSFNGEYVDIIKLIKQIAENYNSIQNEQNKISVNIEGEPTDLFLDQKLIEHAISALISNALKYSEDKKNPEVSITFYHDFCEVIIKDYGMGIPSEDINLIFEPFFRASNALNIEGTGLGTTIIKEYVELNNGTIEVNSELNKGTEFIIQLRK